MAAAYRYRLAALFCKVAPKCHIYIYGAYPGEYTLYLSTACFKIEAPGAYIYIYIYGAYPRRIYPP